MKKLAPGVYDDERGGMHIDLHELLLANGFADTPDNRAMMEECYREYCARSGTPLHVVSSITCPFCGRTSFHPRDIAERYCGACKRFQVT